MADAKLAAIAAEDIGRTALSIFRRGDRFIGKTVSIAGDHFEMANTFQYYVEAADYFTGARDLKVVRELNPQLQSFETWLAVHKDAIRPK
jgi:hypothetical protein